MDFAFAEEQELLRQSAREFLADTYPVTRVAELADSEAGWDPKVWPQLAKLGWLDEELTLLDAALLFEETGGALLPAPLFSTLALARPALAADAELTGEGGFWSGYWQYQRLRSRGNTIEAGTSEVLRNIIAERVLGLPRSR